MKKKISVITLIISILMILTSCKDSKEQDNIDVKVSEFRNLNWASTYIADALGYFEDEGLNISFDIYKDGPIAFQGMHAGDSDFCLLSVEPVIRASEEGFDSSLILTNTDNRTYAFATRGDIQNVKDLKGKTIFGGMPGSSPYSFVLSILEEAGLSENDVSFVNLEYEAAIAALENKQVDGIFMNIYNEKELLEAIPNAKILIDLTDESLHSKLYDTKYSQTTIVTCTKEFAEKNPETVQKFTNASVKALKYIDENEVGKIAEVLLPYFDGMSKEELKTRFSSIKSSYSKTGEIDRAGYETIENFCIDQGLIRRAIGYDNIVQEEFVKKALENNK
ncbi:MAG: ABC transporter substrate-binding protein [Andreesenia angusta]|nr:ABC transporter substrate-binding protein [Andreesenia angusta]